MRDRADLSISCATTKPGAVEIGNHVSCYAGCSFALGENGPCTIGDFTLLNGALIMAEERIEIGSHCLISWNVGIADSDFHPLEPAQRLIDAQALAPFFKDRPPRPKLKTAPVIIARQCLDRDERHDSERRHHRRKLGRRCRLGRDEIVEPNAVVAGNPAVVVKKFSVRDSIQTPNVQRPTPNVRILCVRRWAFDVGRSAFSSLMKRKRIVVMGFMGSMPDRGRHLAAHSLHRRTATARARRFLHRRFGASPV